MAHNLFEHDSMLAVGEAPWHGLGTTLEKPPASGREALQVAKLDWSVDKEPMFLESGEVVAADDAGKERRWGAIVRQDTRTVLGVVGADYVPFQNVQMADLFDPLIQDGTLDVETCGSLFNGRRVWMLGRFGKGVDTIDTNDDVKRYLLLAHGHDGQFAVRFGFTPIRVVCHNTLTMATESGRSKLVRCLHTINLEDNLRVLRDAMLVAEQAFELSADQFRQLAKRGVSYADLREYARIIVDADADQRKWTVHQKKTIGTIVGMARDGRGNKGQNWWHAYNGVTEWVTWSKGRNQDNRLAEAWFGGGLELNRKALDLAIQMSS